MRGQSIGSPKPSTSQGTVYHPITTSVNRLVSSPEDPFVASEVEHKRSHKFGLDDIKYEYRMKESEHGKTLQEARGDMDTMFQHIVTSVQDQSQPGDKVRLYIQHQEFHQDVVVHLRPVELLNVEAILGRLDKITQSEPNLKLDDSYRICTCSGGWGSWI